MHLPSRKRKERKLDLEMMPVFMDVTSRTYAQLEVLFQDCIVEFERVILPGGTTRVTARYCQVR